MIRRHSAGRYLNKLSRDWRPRSEANYSITHVASVVVVESLISRSKFSTPISSASALEERVKMLFSFPSRPDDRQKTTLRLNGDMDSHP